MTFIRWKIANGDDSISMKQNSTNIYIADCEIHDGMALAMGSIAQYPGQINVIANVTAERIKCINTNYAGRVKTWTGTSKGAPPNGGGGGLGHAKVSECSLVGYGIKVSVLMTEVEYHVPRL